MYNIERLGAPSGKEACYKHNYWHHIKVMELAYMY